jgi:uncharacterized membrane protein
MKKKDNKNLNNFIWDGLITISILVLLLIFMFYILYNWKIYSNNKIYIIGSNFSRIMGIINFVFLLFLLFIIIIVVLLAILQRLNFI